MSQPKDTVVAELRSADLGRGGNRVLRDVHVKVWADEIYAIVGGSGSGKSTLLDTLIGLNQPLKGEALLFGRDLGRLDRSSRRRLLQRVGVVFQRDALFQTMTVADNLSVAARELLDLPDEVLAELIALRLEQVGLAGLALRHPYELSGGQQKRVAFARAVMLEPDLIVCDEPTAGLDPVTAATIVKLILQLHAEVGTAVVVVTHDVELACSIATRTAVLGRGQIAAEGSAEMLRSHPDPLVSELFMAARRLAS